MKVPAISSYGLFWERKEDNFLTGKIKIKQGKPGRPRKGAKLHKKVTLNGRRGIYILYSQEREILYCGMGKINERLLAHHKEYNYTNAEQSSRGLEKMWKIFGIITQTKVERAEIGLRGRSPGDSADISASPAVPSGTPGERPISGHGSLCLGYKSEDLLLVRNLDGRSKHQPAPRIDGRR